MARVTTFKEITISNAGGIKDLPIDDSYDYYTVDGNTIVLASDLNITTSDTPYFGVTYEVRYKGNGLDLNGHSLNIFGVALSELQAQKNLIAVATSNGTTFDTDIFMSFSDSEIVSGANIEDEVITANKLSTDVNLYTVTIPVSFETGYIGSDNTIQFESDVEILNYTILVTKLIQASDDASVDIAIDGGSATTVVIPGGTTQNTLASASISLPSTTNPSLLTTTSAKTTAGGAVLITYTYKKI